jgi:hypothetical protein
VQTVVGISAILPRDRFTNLSATPLGQPVTGTPEVPRQFLDNSFSGKFDALVGGGLSPTGSARFDKEPTRQKVRDGAGPGRERYIGTIGILDRHLLRIADEETAGSDVRPV